MLQQICRKIGVDDRTFKDANKRIDYYSTKERKNKDILLVKGRVKVSKKDIKYIREFYQDEVHTMYCKFGISL